MNVTPAIVPMNGDADPMIVGGKASALMRLTTRGFDVPPFATLSREAFDFDGRLRAELQDELGQTLEAIGPGPFAARSSARDEDGSDHSHAGQFLSLLNLSAEQMPDAAARVFASGMEGHVAEYRATRGLDGAGGTAVLVQRMVDPRAAGVMFTADPVSGRRDRIVVSAIAGLGDRLVGGEEDGETTVLDRKGAVIDKPDQSVLSANDFTKLHDLALRVEKATGAPQDIEWAIEGDRLFLLQSRPITTTLLDAPLDDRAITVLDNSNIVESYPGLVSPLTYSFAVYAYARVYRAFVALLGVREDVISNNAAVFDNMLTRVDGRVYYNLGNWYRALALLPGFSINRDHMETMMGVSEPLPAALSSSIGPVRPNGWGVAREWTRMSGSALRLVWEAMRIGRTRRGFQHRLDRALAAPVETIDAMTLTELAAYYRRIEADLLDRWDAPLANDFLCMIAFGASRKLLDRWGGADGINAHNDIMIGQGDIVSAEPAQRIARMGALLEGHEDLRTALARGDTSRLPNHSELEAEFNAYLARFADRCPEELKLESITLDRDPSPLLHAVAASRPNTHKPLGREGDPLERAIPSVWRRAIARPIVNWAKARVRDRENLRFERTRIFGRARRVFRAIGRQLHAHGTLENADDVFMLTVPEVLGAIEGHAVTHDLAALARLRREAMQRSAERPDPPERIVVEGAVVPALAEARPEPSTKTTGDDSERMGTGCSAGTFMGTARVVRDPRSEAIERGDILVARHTDPGWIAVFSNAAAIVVERGSLLSHSAIVAREMGIPCVVALKGATDWIESGETISVDGATGLVRKVSSVADVPQQEAAE